MEDKKEDAKNPVQVAQRIFQVIEALSITGPAGLMELSNSLGLHKSTAHRLLTSLAFMGYVRQDEETGKYMLTFKIVELSSRVLGQLDVPSLVHPCLKKLMEQTGETVHLVQRDGNDAVYIDKVEALSGTVRMVSRVGSRIPLYCSGVGKAILAMMKDGQVRDIWQASKISSLTEHTIISLEKLYPVLAAVRKNGYAMDDEENEIGVRCIAAAVPDYKGHPKYAFSISAPAGRMTAGRVEELAGYVLEMKGELTKILGGV